MSYNQSIGNPRRSVSTRTADPPPSLTDQVVDALARRLDAGEYASHGRLPTESELVAMFGVSRTVVREAISQLRARGLVQTRRGIGTFAREPASVPAFPRVAVDPHMLDEVLALLELRMSLETEGAALAAKRRSDEQAAHLAQLLAAIEATAQGPAGDAADADFAFHLTIAEATGNHFFPELLRHLGRAIIPRTRIDSPAVAHEAREDYLRRVNREHHDILQAIQGQDSDAARAAMRTHLSNSRERLRQLRAGL